MAREKEQTVATTREWNPSHTTDLADIQGAIDSWDRRHAAAPATATGSPAPPRDYAAIQEAVDRITKRVKTRKVVVRETVTEYVEEEVPAESVETVPASSPEGVAELATVAKPVEEAKEPKKLGFFARRKAAKEAKEGKGAEAPAGSSFTPVVEAAPRRGVTIPDDAWDPGTAAAVEAPKPLQSKAAKRTAGKGKKASKKKR